MMHTTPGDVRFKEVEETIDFQLRFPSGVLANCTSSYGYAGQNRYRVITTKGWFELEPATSYTGLRMRVRRGNATEERDLPQRDHFAPEMDHLSECVMEDKEPLTPGEEGLRDLKHHDGDLRGREDGPHDQGLAAGAARRRPAPRTPGVLTSAAAPRSRGCSPSGTIEDLGVARLADQRLLAQRLAHATGSDEVPAVGDLSAHVDRAAARSP